MGKPIVNLLSTNSELQSVTFRILLVETSGSAAADEDMVLVKSALTSIDALNSKNQALFEYCTNVNNLKYC